MCKGKKLLSKKTVFVMTFPLFLLSFVDWQGPVFNLYPTDRELEEKFRNNEAAFNRLAAMFIEDKHLSSISEEAIDKSFGNRNSVVLGRMAEYRELLQELELLGVDRGEKSGNLYLKVWHSDGFPLGGSYKYFVYAVHPPGNLVDSLDKVKYSGQDGNTYKSIGGNWYLYLDVW